MPGLHAWIRLFRPWNAVIAGAAVWLGWACLRLRPEWQLALWGSLSMVLLVAAGNADNDAVDARADRVNRPRRPVASGEVSATAARIAAVLLYITGIFLAWVGTPVHGLLAAVMAVLLIAYNRYLKGTAIAGNFTIGLLCALAVYFTEFPLFPGDTVPAALFALLAPFAREVAKDAEDIEGDRAAGLRTYAVIWGAEDARRLSLASLALLLLALPLPMFLYGYHWAYAAVVVAVAGPVIVPLLGDLSRKDANFGRIQRLLKLLMLAGMLALWAGTIGR
jgi:geranylgeranylglycerol-phosphate geranylgeranyltransferase